VKLAVARSLAGNTRAFVQIGKDSDIARAFVASELMAGARTGIPDPTENEKPTEESIGS
jgi:hypothetical protein